MRCDLDGIFPGVSVGDSFQGSVTFDTEAGPGIPRRFVRGSVFRSVGAPVSFRIETADGVFGGRSFVETLVANDRFQPLGNPLIATDTISFSDLESVFLPPQPTALDLTLRDDDASILSDETLPLNPPSLDALELARAGVSGGFFRIGLISGPITSLSLEAPAVPEPMALVVFVIGLLIVRRMVGRVSSTGS